MDRVLCVGVTDLSRKLTSLCSNFRASVAPAVSTSWKFREEMETVFVPDTFANDVDCAGALRRVARASHGE